MLRSLEHILARFSLMVACALSTGCGSSLYTAAPVSGRVMCGDKPAVGGTITFEPIDAPDKTGRPPGEPGRVSRGIVAADGSFSLVMDAGGGDSPSNGALIGPHRVSFILPQSTPWEWNPQDNWLAPEEQERLKAQLAQKPVHPPLDSDGTISPAEVEVKSGGNTLEFTLQTGTGSSKPPAKSGGSD